MTHRWAPVSRQKSFSVIWPYHLMHPVRAEQPDWLPLWAYRSMSSGHPRCCIKCGASLWSTKSDRHVLPLRWFRPYASMVQRIHHMPPCEGLPTSYDAPMGA